MKGKVVYRLSCILIVIRIVVPLMLAVTSYTMIGRKIECILNVMIISLLVYIGCMYVGKNRRIILLVTLLSLNTVYNLVNDLLLCQKESFYFKSPTKQTVLLVEVGESGYASGKMVDVYERCFFVLKKPFCVKEILVDSYETIYIEWHNDEEIILVVEHTKGECERFKIAYPSS